MKKCNVIIILLLLTSVAFSQYEFTASVQNQSSDGTDFTFDIYLLRTGTSDIYLGDSDFAFDFNSENFTNPVASVTGAAERIWNWYLVSASIVSENIVVLNIGKPNWNDQSQFDSRIQVISTSGHGTLIGTIKITNISNASGSAGLVWRTSGQNMTKVNSFEPTEPWAQSSVTDEGTYTPADDHTLSLLLLSFTGISEPSGVLLKWQTSMEMGVAGYYLDRSINEQEWVRIADWQSSAALQPKGLYEAEPSYRYFDESAEPDKFYYYRLGQIDVTGIKKVYSTISVQTLALPKTTQLNKIYPNPFNPQTTISYQLADDLNVEIVVYDVLGRQVRRLVDRPQKAGQYDVLWNGKNGQGESVASGIYQVQMRAGDYHQIRQISYLK